MPLDIEDDLIESAKRGGAALERLIIAVWPEAYRIAFVMLRDVGLAEDAAQDACASIARSLPTLRNNGGFAAWSYRIITNHAMTKARQRSRIQTLDTVSDRAIHTDQCDAIDLCEALAALPLAQRAAVLLHYYAGLTSREIAAATGLPASTVRFHLMLARRALHRALSIRENPDAPQTSEEAITNVR